MEEEKTFAFASAELVPIFPMRKVATLDFDAAHNFLSALLVQSKSVTYADAGAISRLISMRIGNGSGVTSEMTAFGVV
ncbi:hypothetical protein D3C86_1820920 [compost metagenome]